MHEANKTTPGSSRNSRNSTSGSEHLRALTRRLFFQLDTSSPSVSWLTETVLRGEVAVNGRGSRRGPALSFDIRDHDSKYSNHTQIRQINHINHVSKINIDQPPISPPAPAQERAGKFLRVHLFCCSCYRLQATTVMVLCAHPFASLPAATVLVRHLFQAGILDMLDTQASFSSTQFPCGEAFCVWQAVFK